MASPWRRFVFRLALAMGRPVRALLSEIDSAELTEWLAFERLEPFGGMWDDFRSGQICATVANMAGMARNADAPPAQAADFMPALAAQSGASTQGSTEPVLLDDPIEHAHLLRARLFGVMPDGN